MIPSYQEEIRIRKNKDRVFWLVVGIMTVFLYFFFQGYYPNYERFLDRPDSSKQAFLKPFGIIDLHVFPSPDVIKINDEDYNNNSKTIFDLGQYSVSIQKNGYLPIEFLLDITRKNPFYTNAINLLALPEYSGLPIAFEKLFPSNGFFVLQTKGTGSFLVTDSSFRVLHSIQTVYKYIGGLYFTDGNNILTYSFSTETFTSVIDSASGLPLRCLKIGYFEDKLFCYDTMRFVGPKASDINENILLINKHIVVTPKYIYNQDTTYASWKYFEYQTGSISLPKNIVRVGKIPYVLENGLLSPLDKTRTPSEVFSQKNIDIPYLEQAYEFHGETILLGKDGVRAKFQILDGERHYDGLFDFEDAKNIEVQKVNDVYVFTTPNALYVYYKGAKNIIKILQDVEIIHMLDSKIFFKKDGKNYMIDILRKLTK